MYPVAFLFHPLSKMLSFFFSSIQPDIKQSGKILAPDILKNHFYLCSIGTYSRSFMMLL